MRTENRQRSIQPCALLRLKTQRKAYEDFASFAAVLCELCVLSLFWEHDRPTVRGRYGKDEPSPRKPQAKSRPPNQAS